jgi:GTPase SAR1 family protein
MKDSQSGTDMDHTGLSLVSARMVQTFNEVLTDVSASEEREPQRTQSEGWFWRAAAKYSRILEGRYSTVRIFAMPRPIPLRSIYVRVNVLERPLAHRGTTIEELEEMFDRDRRTFKRILQTTDGFSTIDRLDKVMVVGKPGSGKTTLLRSLILHALDRQFRTSVVPIFISLKDWSDSNKSLEDFVSDDFHLCGFPDAGTIVRTLFQSGRSLLLLDGLDEMTGDVDAALRQLRSFVDRYHDNKMVISCRIAAGDYVFERFTEIEIADFDEDQIHQFISNWFGTGSEKAGLCWATLRSEPAIRELASIPLLLTMLCVTFDEVMHFPSNRAELYREAVDALLKKWDASRSIRRDEAYKHLSLRRKEDMLSVIAFRAFSEMQYFIPEARLEQCISDYMEHLPEGAETTQVDGRVILRAIEAQHGLLIQRARGVYSFSHLTIQEYFCARFIVDNEARSTVAELMRHLLDRRWREVLVLTVEMLTDATECFALMLVKIRELESSKSLKSLFGYLMKGIEVEKGRYLPSDWTELEEIAGVTVEVKDFCIKLGHYELAFGVREIEQAVKMAIRQRRELEGDLGGAQDDGEALNLSDEELDMRGEAFINYLVMIDILERCARTLCYMSVKVRSGVEEVLREGVVGVLCRYYERVAKDNLAGGKG